MIAERRDRQQFPGYNPLIKRGAREGRPNADRYVISRLGPCPRSLNPARARCAASTCSPALYTNEAGKSPVTDHRELEPYLTSTEENTGRGLP